MIEAIKEIFMMLGMCVVGLAVYTLLHTIIRKFNRWCKNGCKNEWKKNISRKHGRVIPEQKHWKSRFHANLKNMFQIFRTIYFPLKNVRNAEHLLLVKK